MRSRSRILRDSYSKNLMAARETSGSGVVEPGELPQKRVQLGPFRGLERRQELLRGLARLTLEHPHLPLAFLGQVERLPAPVLGVHAALCESALLEVVEDRDHRARVDAPKRREVLLRDPGALGNDGHEAKLPRVEAVGLELCDEAPARLLAEVSEQKARVARELF